MAIRFVIDADTGVPHLYNHGVGEQEAVEVAENPGLRLRGDRGSTIALGQTLTGRYLKVVYRLIDGDTLIITAFDLRGKALKAYRRRLRRKGQ